jgi:hypothetical protein
VLRKPYLLPPLASWPKYGVVSHRVSLPNCAFLLPAFDRYGRRLLPGAGRPWQALQPSVSPVVPGGESSPVDALGVFFCLPPRPLKRAVEIAQHCVGQANRFVDDTLQAAPGYQHLYFGRTLPPGSVERSSVGRPSARNCRFEDPIFQIAEVSPRLRNTNYLTAEAERRSVLRPNSRICCPSRRVRRGREWINGKRSVMLPFSSFWFGPSSFVPVFWTVRAKLPPLAFPILLHPS